MKDLRATWRALSCHFFVSAAICAPRGAHVLVESHCSILLILNINNNKTSTTIAVLGNAAFHRFNCSFSSCAGSHQCCHLNAWSLAGLSSSPWYFVVNSFSSGHTEIQSTWPVCFCFVTFQHFCHQRFARYVARMILCYLCYYRNLRATWRACFCWFSYQVFVDPQSHNIKTSTTLIVLENTFPEFAFRMSNLAVLSLLLSFGFLIVSVDITQSCSNTVTKLYLVDWNLTQITSICMSLKCIRWFSPNALKTAVWGLVLD